MSKNRTSTARSAPDLGLSPPAKPELNLGSIAEAIVAALGGVWRVETYNGDSVSWRVHLVDGKLPSALRLAVGLDRGTRHLSVGLAQLKHPGEGGRPIIAHDVVPYDQRSKVGSISLDAMRPARQLARDIVARKIKPGRPVWQAMLKHRDEVTLRLAAAETWEARLGAAWNARPVRHVDRSQVDRTLYLEPGPDQVGGEVRITSLDSIELKLRCSPETAVKLGVWLRKPPAPVRVSARQPAKSPKGPRS